MNSLHTSYLFKAILVALVLSNNVDTTHAIRDLTAEQTFAGLTIPSTTPTTAIPPLVGGTAFPRYPFVPALPRIPAWPRPTVQPANPAVADLPNPTGVPTFPNIGFPPFRFPTIPTSPSVAALPGTPVGPRVP